MFQELLFDIFYTDPELMYSKNLNDSQIDSLIESLENKFFNKIKEISPEFYKYWRKLPEFEWGPKPQELRNEKSQKY
jgi:hypothetical protein